VNLGQGGEDAPLLFALQAAVAGPARLGIAVSGGSDSLALLHLSAELAPAMGWDLRAATVDHALRPESAAEALRVGEICAGLGVPHEVLRWQHGAIAGNLQDQARRARYGLLAGWARGLGLDQVLIGHTADDQAETFLMGLSRSAGLDGLSGMRRSWQEAGVGFCRPMLRVARAQLQDYLRRRGVGWIDDPSNDNDRFARIKARRALSAMAELGITPLTLAESVAHLAGAQRGLKAATAAAWARYGQEAHGALLIGWEDFQQLDPELRRRLVQAAIDWLGNDAYAPRGSKVLGVVELIARGRDATLAGCRFRVTKAGLLICRELKAVKALESATTDLWDKRWQMQGPHAEGLSIRALGAEGLVACKDWRALQIPRDVLLVSPAIWRDATLIAAPVAGFSEGWQANVRVSLNELLLSH
jgi:tRNA(Ile)-lysidine synthase